MTNVIAGNKNNRLYTSIKDVSKTGLGLDFGKNPFKWV
jgi:hypothetical protein